MHKLFKQVLFGRGGFEADRLAIQFVDKVFPTVPQGRIFSTMVETSMVFGTALTVGTYNVFIFVVCTGKKIYEKEIIVDRNHKPVEIDRLIANDWYDLVGGLLKINLFRKVNSTAYGYDGIREVMANFAEFAKKDQDGFMSLVRCLERNSNSTYRCVSGGLPSLGKRAR